MKPVCIVLVCLSLSALLMFGVRVSPSSSSGWLSWLFELGKGSAAVFLLSAAAYTFKRRCRTVYGVAELLIFLPTAMSFLLGLAQKASPNDVPRDWSDWSVSSLIILGLITVGLAGVRALEDIGEGLSGKCKKRWDAVFQRPHPTGG
jgi:hypothetical protein